MAKRARVVIEFEVSAKYAGNGTGAIGEIYRNVYETIRSKLSGEPCTVGKVRRITVTQQDESVGRRDLYKAGKFKKEKSNAP